MFGLLSGLVLCAGLAQASEDGARAASRDHVRYDRIEKLIKRNRHMSGHLVPAVDARTIEAVRKQIGKSDIPVLVDMMGDSDHGVASAASGLLVTIGKDAEPALAAAARSKDSSIAAQAQGALRLLEDCGDGALREVMNPAVCPADPTGGKTRSGKKGRFTTEDAIRAFVRGEYPLGDDYFIDGIAGARILRCLLTRKKDGIDGIALSETSIWGNRSGPWDIFERLEDGKYAYAGTRRLTDTSCMENCRAEEYLASGRCAWEAGWPK